MTELDDVEEESPEKEFLVTYLLRDQIEIYNTVTAECSGTVNMRWKRQYINDAWVTVKEPCNGGIRVFRARDVLAVHIKEK